MILKANLFQRAFLVLTVLFFSTPLLAKVWPGEKPKLIVVIVIDQFRADYLSRYQSKFTENGFKALMQNGAYYPYGEYDILQSMTCPGHATVMTGAYPYKMGIPINEWYDQKTHQEMYCVGDPDAKEVSETIIKSRLDDPHSASEASVSTLPSTLDKHVMLSESHVSPRNINGSTVGDELKNSDWPTRTFSLALKDRAAILMAGHRADLAFWYNTQLNRWVTSDYYIKSKDFPDWLNSLNKITEKRKCDIQTTCGVELTTQAFKAAFDNLKLGQTNTTDILTMSFSSHDLAGHRYGPNSPEIEAMTISEDRAMAEILKTVKAKMGRSGKFLLVLTGDHGVASTPKYLLDHKIDAGLIDDEKLVNEMEKNLTKEFGPIKSKHWIKFSPDFNFYLDEQEIKEAGLEIKKIENSIKNYLLEDPRFVSVFTADDFDKGLLPPSMFKRQVEKTYYQGRSGHVIAIQKPFYINGTKNHASHMTGYTYDRTVPIIFSGYGIKNGVYADKAEVVDIAPTLSFLLGIIPPALSEGRVLKEALK